jgi:hypothetical protein
LLQTRKRPIQPPNLDQDQTKLEIENQALNLNQNLEIMVSNREVYLDQIKAQTKATPKVTPNQKVAVIQEATKTLSVVKSRRVLL